MSAPAKARAKHALHKIARKINDPTGAEDATGERGDAVTELSVGSAAPLEKSTREHVASPSTEDLEGDTVLVQQFSQWSIPSDEREDQGQDSEVGDTDASRAPKEKRAESQQPAASKMWGLGSSSAAETEAEESARKYVMRVTAGPSYDRTTHVPVPVNSRSPVHLAAQSMDILLYVRIRDFDGLPRHSPPSQSWSPYFDSSSRKNDQYSIGFSFVPKRKINADRLVWGNDFDHPVRDRLPPGFNTAFRIVKDFIDPGLECDAYADEPWLYGPALSCWFAMDVGPKIGDGTSGAIKWPDSAKDGTIALEEGDTDDIRESLGIPSASQKRRKHFLKQPHRAAFDFEPGRLYSADFYNPYLDFNKFALKLPGFSLGVLRYIGDKTHTLRYIFKELGDGGPSDKKSGEVFFVVEMTLLFGDDATKGIAEDKQRAEQGGDDDVD